MQPVATQYDSSKQNKAGRVVTSGWNLAEVNQFRMNSADPPYINGAYIDDFLRTYYPDSPLIGQGNTIKELSDYYGISVGAALGVWAKETTFGRAHPGLVDHNYGCIRHTSEWPAVWYGGSAWNKYPDKRTGIAAWFKLVRWFYVETGQANYNDFLNKYSPTFENNQATFKNIMWGVLKALGYNMSASVTKTNHSQQSDDPRNIQVTQTKQPTVIAQPKRVGGSLTETGSQGARGLSVSVIGDSLGVGTQSPLASLITDINFDVLGSRQITHATDNLNATKTLQTMLNNGSLKDFVVFIIGTNRGVTKAEVDAVVNLIGNRKLILVTTASQVAHNTNVRNEYIDASKRHNNVYVADWYSEAQSFMAQYYTVESGKYIHMTATGYRKHAEFIAQAIHEANTAVFVGESASKLVDERVSIEELELNEEGILKYTDDTGTHTIDTGVKGLYSPLGDGAIYHSEANQLWGYGSSVNSSNWIEGILDLSEVTDPVELMLVGMKDLKERSVPAAQYTINLIDIDENISIGDTGIFVDHEFNPPLYIQARILSITTSKTNANLNQVLIGNVVELIPEEKDFLHAIRAELQISREQTRREQIEESPITAQITSNNGLVLGDAFEETTLEVQVYRGIQDITSQFSEFVWERVSDDSASDIAFNASLETDNTLLVKAQDIINNQAKFTVKVFNDADEIVKQANVDLKRIDTALWIDTDTPPESAKEGAKWVGSDGVQKVKVDGAWEEAVTQRTASEIVKRDGTTISFSDVQPVTGKSGDVWFKLNSDGTESIMRYGENGWYETVTNALSADGIIEGTMDFSIVNAININASSISAGHADFVTVALQALNSRLSLDGASINIENEDGSYVEMTSVPEIRARSVDSSMVVMGDGRTTYTVDDIERFYMGAKIADSQHGVMIRKDEGWAIMRESDSFGGVPAKYYTVKYGEQRVAVVEALMADPTVTEIPTGDATRFIINSNYLGRMNGFTTLNSSTVAAPWPTLKKDQQIKYANEIPGNESGIQSIYEIWTEESTSVSAFGAHVTFNQGYANASDRRIKQDIAPTLINALSEIEALDFKEFTYIKDERYEPIGLIAQDAGILRVPSERIEAIDSNRAIMLALKGVQELEEVVKEQALEIEELKGMIINGE